MNASAVLKTRATLVNLFVAFLMLGGKWFAYFLTDSSVIFSDAMESIAHLFATVISAACLWYSKQPPDKEHPYGHGKIVYFSSALEGILILFSAIIILFLAIHSFIEGPELHQLSAGIVILAVLSLVNLFLGRYLLHVGKQVNSLILIANGKHVLTDMYTSLGVLVGVILVRFTGLAWLDPVFAILVSVNIAWISIRLLLSSYQGLLERADEKTGEKIIAVLEESIADQVILSYHALRHRHVDDTLWIEVDLLFPEEMTIKEVHKRACSLEMNLKEVFNEYRLMITTHLEPEHHDHPEGHPELIANKDIYS